jgi:Glutaminase
VLSRRAALEGQEGRKMNFHFCPICGSSGKGGLGTFAPLLDSAGNSVEGQLVAKFLSQQLGMDLFVSNPEA